MGLSQIGIAIPNFWFAILLILLFSVELKWFSAGGVPGWEEDWVDALRALMLPALSLAVVQAAILARITRSAVLEVLREDFVRTARAKGASQRRVLWGHVLRNAMVPVVTVSLCQALMSERFGLVLPVMIAGGVPCSTVVHRIGEVGCGRRRTQFPTQFPTQPRTRRRRRPTAAYWSGL
jgi:ABC-type microcin C transport system permease subunit YejB